jgi:hypothetical protein
MTTDTAYASIATSVEMIMRRFAKLARSLMLGALRPVRSQWALRVLPRSQIHQLHLV